MQPSTSRPQTVIDGSLVPVLVGNPELEMILFKWRIIPNDPDWIWESWQI